ncbi:MAG: D-alanyl-D-alanine carboxypeptidase family protein [Candidatus Aenigmarchaeota archaeon]|nr:D-alanyl-D-alanine carboxypeptidase family protein [Candidatus Aenigmarchaeota archaeon]
MQLWLVFAVFFYIAYGPYASIYEQAIDQVKTPVEIAWRSVRNAFYDIYLLATNPTEWYARQQVINARPEKPISFPKALEINTLDVTPPSVPGGQPFVLTFVMKNDGDLAARNIKAKVSCNQWCDVPPPRANLQQVQVSLCRNERWLIGDQFYCAENCGDNPTIKSGLLPECISQCIDEAKKPKVHTFMTRIPVTNTCLTKDLKEFEHTYWPKDPKDKPTMQRGEAQIVTVEPFVTNIFQGGAAETRIAKVYLNVSYEHSTTSQLLVTVIGEEEKQRLIRERKLEFKPVVATHKVSPAKLSLNVGPQPLQAGKEATLLVSVSNDRDQSSILLAEETGIIITLPKEIGSNLRCLGGTEPGQYFVDAKGEPVAEKDAVAEQLIYNVQANPKTGRVEILAYEFNTIYTFLCRFNTKDVEGIKTGIVTANLTSYTFVHTIKKDVPVTTPLGILFDPYSSYCNQCGKGVLTACSRDICHDLSDTDTRNLGVCYYDSLAGTISDYAGTVCYSCGEEPRCDQFLTEQACTGEALPRCEITCIWDPDKNTYWHNKPLKGKCVEGRAIAPTVILTPTATGTVVGIPKDLTQNILQAYLQANARGMLAQQANVFFTLGQKYNIDPAFAVAVAMHESDKGQSNLARKQNNYFGITEPGGEMQGFRSYSTPQQAIEAFYRLIKNDYITNCKGAECQNTPNNIACGTGSVFTDADKHCYVVGGRDAWIDNVPKFRQTVLDLIVQTAPPPTTPSVTVSVLPAAPKELEQFIIVAAASGTYEEIKIELLDQAKSHPPVNELKCPKNYRSCSLTVLGLSAGTYYAKATLLDASDQTIASAEKQFTVSTLPPVAYSKPDLMGLGTQITSLQQEVQAKFNEMETAAASDGVPLVIASGYRNFQQQLGIWNNKVQSATGTEQEKVDKAAEYNSMPGLSRHHFGTEIDINSVNPADWEPGCVGTSCQGAVYTWLINNAARFGFCQPYNADRGVVKAEPWHWSYKPISKSMAQQHMSQVTAADLQGRGVAGESTIIAKFDKYHQGFVSDINPNCLS